ncbi:MAG: SDR family oxidoreductase [Actinobacteria bacterium]|nr:SDR family oxidoreductase [Actinomycetota bacterium]
MPTAVITGASRGFGCAVATALARRGWELVVDGRTKRDLRRAAVGFRRAGSPRVADIAGDIGDPSHRLALQAAVDRRPVDLLVNNASTLGVSPLPRLDELAVETLRDVLTVNLIGPFALTQALLPNLRERSGLVVNVSSDAAVEAYPAWGGYGASKAALDHLTAVLAEEQPTLRAYAFDPGDMRTEMHRAAFPGEDISDRPEPETVVPALLRLIDERPASGRYRAAELLVEVAA